MQVSPENWRAEAAVHNVCAVKFCGFNFKVTAAWMLWWSRVWARGADAGMALLVLSAYSRVCPLPRHISNLPLGVPKTGRAWRSHVEAVRVAHAIA